MPRDLLAQGPAKRQPRDLLGGSPTPIEPSRINQAFEAAEDQPRTTLYDKIPTGYGVTDYMQSQLPFAKDIGAAVGAAGPALMGRGGFSEEWQKRRALEDYYAAEYARDNPGKAWLGTGASVAALAPSAAAGAVGARALIGQGATTGAVLGAGGHGNTLAERAQSVGAGALTGGAGGAVAGAVGKALNPVARRTAEQFKKASRANYKESEAIGAAVTPRAFDDIVTDLSQVAKKWNVDPGLQPGSSALLGKLQQQAGQAKTFAEMDNVRKLLGQVAKSPVAADRELATTLMHRLDDRLDMLSPAQVTGSDPKRAASLLDEARKNWRTARKLETVDNLVEEAQLAMGANFSMAGFETAIKQKFRGLAVQMVKDPRVRRQFTATEREMIKKVATGGGRISPANILRYFGKLAPTGAVSAGVSGGIGFAVGGPMGAVAVPAAGFAAREAAALLTKRNVQGVTDTILQTGPGWQAGAGVQTLSAVPAQLSTKQLPLR